MEFYDDKKKLIAKYRLLIEQSKGGIFTHKTRMRLTGIQGLSDREKTKNDFPGITIFSTQNQAYIY